MANKVMVLVVLLGIAVLVSASPVRKKPESRTTQKSLKKVNLEISTPRTLKKESTTLKTSGKVVSKSDLKTTSVHIIDLPPKCRPGEKMGPHGICKPVWKRSVEGVEREEQVRAPACVIDCEIPDRPCPEGQKPDANGVCRDEWGYKSLDEEPVKEEKGVLAPACVIGCEIPDRPCPVGQKPDRNGVCRDEWRFKVEKSSVEAEPMVEPVNEEPVVVKKRSVEAEPMVEPMNEEPVVVKKRSVEAEPMDGDISVSPQCLIGCNVPGRGCPSGQQQDASGNCRDSWYLSTMLRRLRRSVPNVVRV